MAPKHNNDNTLNRAGSKNSKPERSKSAAHGRVNRTSTLVGFDNENISYMNAQKLSRPLDMPRNVMVVLIVALVVAAFIGVIMIYGYADNVLNASAKEQEALEENLSREVSRDLPHIAEFVDMDDEAIINTLRDTGATFYERTTAGSSEFGGFEIIKLPEDVGLDDAIAMYSSGINNLNASEIVKLLNGSWDLTVNRDNGLNIYVSYADFSSKSLGAAVQKAINDSDLRNEEIIESGVDDSGNTFATGIVSIEDVDYTWRVSAITLTDMYTASGIPDNSYFVGVRLTN